jgi:hypothetical protein
VASELIVRQGLFLASGYDLAVSFQREKSKYFGAILKKPSMFQIILNSPSSDSVGNHILFFSMCFLDILALGFFCKKGRVSMKKWGKLTGSFGFLCLEFAEILVNR